MNAVAKAKAAPTPAEVVRRELPFTRQRVVDDKETTRIILARPVRLTDEQLRTLTRKMQRTRWTRILTDDDVCVVEIA